MADPSDFKFFTDDMKLVDYYLRNRVSTGQSNFITDINLYEEEPWLLPHVYHSQFYDKEWFYFVTRTLRAGKTPKRTVPGRGGSESGTWTTTGKKKILDNNKIVIGYKSELSYHKKINGKTKDYSTGWCMTEYSLASPDDNEDLFQEVVLCHIREKKGIAEQFRFRPEINNNNVVDDDNDDEATQRQQLPLLPELGQDSRSRKSQLVVFMKDDYVDQDFVFDLHDQTKIVVQPQQESNHNFQDIARGQDMMTPTVTNNPYAITCGLKSRFFLFLCNTKTGKKKNKDFRVLIYPCVRLLFSSLYI